ncbi:MAG: hypothetical protein ACRCX2_03340 [Paraclostridium sp.]
MIHLICFLHKDGIETYRPRWYSQSPYYYFEEFLECNEIKEMKYNIDEVEYEKERMYWVGYCLQTWSNKEKLLGKLIVTKLGEKGIKHLLDNYNIYHTVDPMYVLDDTVDYL